MSSQPQPQKPYRVLTPSQVSHFLTHGYVVIPDCFTADFAASHLTDLCTRLGISPTDKSTWTTAVTGPTGKVNMPTADRTVPIPEKAWGAMCDLLGGEERISRDVYGGPGGKRVDAMSWGDGFIVNLGREEDGEGKEDYEINPHELGNWHVDGDFFTHFLDSPEQGLLVIPCWTDIVPGGGGTFICPDGIKDMAEHLVSFSLSPSKSRQFILPPLPLPASQ